MLSVFVYDGLTSIEVTKVTLKCDEKIHIAKDQPDVTYLYKITKHLFSDIPVGLYNPSPDTDISGYPPYLIGLFESDPRVQNKTYNIEHSYPEYFTFVTYENATKPKRSKVEMITYINRKTLSIEVKLPDGQLWSTGQCAIVNNSEFDDDHKSGIEELKKNLKI